MREMVLHANRYEFKFVESQQYVMKDSKIFRTVTDGLVEDKLRTTRKIGKYRICAEHFNCALPYTNYYIIDTAEQVIYEYRECTTSILKEIVTALKEMIE